MPILGLCNAQYFVCPRFLIFFPFLRWISQSWRPFQTRHLQWSMWQQLWWFCLPHAAACQRIGAGRRRGPSWARLSCRCVTQICLINANLICALALTPSLPSISPVLTLQLDCLMNMLTQGKACDSQPLTVIMASQAVKRINLFAGEDCSWKCVKDYLVQQNHRKIFFKTDFM